MEVEEVSGVEQVKYVKKRYGGYILSFVIAVAAGVLLRCLYAASPNPVMATLAPVNNSPWELGKMVFWPYLAGALATHRLTHREDSRAGQCLTLIGMTFMMILGCWAGRRFFDSCLAIWLIVLAAGIVLYATVLRKKTLGGELLWYALAILLGIAFVLFSAMPPASSLFTDPAHVAAMATIPC